MDKYKWTTWQFINKDIKNGGHFKILIAQAETEALILYRVVKNKQIKKN